MIDGSTAIVSKKHIKDSSVIYTFVSTEKQIEQSMESGEMQITYLTVICIGVVQKL